MVNLQGFPIAAFDYRRVDTCLYLSHWLRLSHCEVGFRRVTAAPRMVAAAIIFLLTATRDEQLFRALEEAAHSVVEKKGTAQLFADATTDWLPR